MDLSLSAACGSGGGISTGTATVTGTIRGQSLPAADAISAPIILQEQSGTSIQGFIAVTSSAALCGQLTAGKQPKSTKYFLLLLGDVNAATQLTTAPTEPGTYTVWDGTGQRPSKVGVASYLQTDTQCQLVPLAFAIATSGTVRLTSASNGSYSGTFDLTLNSGDHITGSFTAANCATSPSLIDPNTTLLCM